MLAQAGNHRINARMPPSGSGEPLEPLYEDDGARVLRRETKSFLFFRVTGRVTPGLVRRLRRLLYQRPRGNVALETADLAGVNAAFVGQLRMIAREVEDRGDTFVLVAPGERVRDLLALGGSDTQVRILADAAELTDDLAALHGRERALGDIADAIARESAGNGTWRLRDRAGTWLCPVCGEFAAGVRPPDGGDWPMAALQAAAAHLLDHCPPWADGQRRLLPVRVLQARLAQAEARARATSLARVDQLEATVTTLRAVAERSAALDAAIEKARDRQRRLLPRDPPAIYGIDWGLLYRPSARVSGDFYDFVATGPQSIGVLVGDVSGHGIEAAILMGMAKKVCWLRLRELGDGARALVQANEDLRHDLDGRTFVSACVAVLNLGTRQLTVARAGHNPPMLFNPARDPAIQEIEPPGMVLGMADAGRFALGLRAETVGLQRGDTVLLYTDGVTECESPAGEEFGTTRLGEFLADHAGVPMQPTLEELRERLVSFQGGEDRAQDDLTVIALRLS